MLTKALWIIFNKVCILLLLGFKITILGMQKAVNYSPKRKIWKGWIGQKHFRPRSALLSGSLEWVLYTYTAERRDALGCTSPTTKRFPEAREMSRGRSPRDISRAEGNLEVGGDVQPNTSRFEAVYGHSLIINPSLGMYQEIHPCRVSSTYSVKINTSLPMMREWKVLTCGKFNSYFTASFLKSKNLS